MKRIILALFLNALLAILSPIKIYATHLMGGSMTYEYMGMVGTDQSYLVTLKIYRYCDASAGGTAPLDASMFLGIYNQDVLNPNADKNWFRTENLPLVSSSFVTPPSIGSNCSFTTTVCVEEGIFEAIILVPPDPGGYHLIVERCCRNGNIVNLSTPGSIGQAYYCFIPPAPIINSSPQFSDIPVPFICAGDLASIINNATDPDGDSLVYSFEVPYGGYSSSGIAIPDPQFDNNPYAFPIPPVMYNPGYSVGIPFGAGGTSTIDPQTGLTNYSIPNQGFYVVAIEIKEYRNGVLVAMIRRDLQLIAIVCPPNGVPVLSNANGSGQASYTITEGQTICFPVTFTDPNGDSLYLTSSGNIFNSTLFNPAASLANAAGDGIVSSQFCWSTECGMARSTPYQFVASVTDNGCPPKITNQIYSIKVNPGPANPVPSISILANPSGPVCIGTLVTFTALPTFGGTNPSFQWQLNGVNVGTNSSSWSSSTLNNGDIITVSMVSNSICVTAFNAVSPPYVMVVNPFAAPSVSIVQAPLGVVCEGDNLIFTATPVNPGATPVYQWTVNGTNTGANSPTFSSSTLTIGSQVAVSLTANAGCPAAASNILNPVIDPILTPSVTITSDNVGAICPGEQVIFRAFPTYGGTAPAYQWQVNGINVGTNSNIFTTTTLTNGDIVKVILTSSETCVTAATATSNTIAISVTAPTFPVVTITANPAGPVCDGDNIIFTATPVNGGGTPTFLWKINGINTGTGGLTYASDVLNNGDQISVVMTSSLTCLVTAKDTSNIITVTIIPVVPVSATITISPSASFCDGTNVTFTASAVNGGTNPAYQWQVNGVNSGTNSTTFSTSTLASGDVIRVNVSSNGTCVSPVNATSNPITVTVLPLVTPAVSIVANPSGPICAGTIVQFTASPSFQGPSPTYEWLVNGVVTGNNAAVFTSSNLADNDIVRVRLTSSNGCAVPATVNSNAIVMQVDPILVPDANITVLPAGPVCDGTSLTFNATTVNPGNAPVYQWLVNGVPTGASASSISLSTLSDGDTVNVRLVSNALCASPTVAISNTIEVEMLPYLDPAITISMQPASPVCDGDTIVFSANGINGGTNPVYTWFLNGNVVSGNNSDTYAAQFADGDLLQAVLTSNYQCRNFNTDTSNTLTAQVIPNVTPTVSISVNPQGAVCPGDLLTFTANTTNEGGAPVYEWTLNGNPIGSNNAVYVSSSLVNGDQIRLKLTSSIVCVTATSAFSNIITVQVSQNITPDVTISVVPNGFVCDGDTLSFAATYTGAGTSPVFDWRVNGVSSAITPVFTTTQLNNGDQIDLIIGSSAFCALPVTDTSNVIIVQIDPLLTPVVSITANPPGVFCDGTEITYSASGILGGLNPSYQWLLNNVSVGSNSDTLISDSFLNGDTLTLIYTSTERCLAVNPVQSNLIIIERYPDLVPEITGPDEVCFGQEITFSVSGTGGNGGPYHYQWNNGLGTATGYTFVPIQTETYIVAMNDSCSATRYDSITVIVNPLPEPAFTISPTQATILNPFFDFVDASLNTVTWYWTFGDNTSSTLQFPSHTYLVPGTFPVKLTAVSMEGCIDSTFGEVFVENVVTFYIPNSFTPNGDGINDNFGVTGYSVEGYDLSIWGRWGQPIFISEGPYDQWDGLDENGKPLPEGVYVYQLKVTNDPDKKVRTGTVTLIR
ncbi:MAG: gliding motility-associated C-terminal domain-containing protein [Bacteroidetes bacterium]|nr:gliding motility-associated C-terminal domain-containing protein [Bacteroidota bacterium]